MLELTSALLLCPEPVEEVVSPPIADYRAERNLARAAEFLVAFDVSRRGWDCFTVGESLRYDLIADINGLRRIQVKMCRGPRQRIRLPLGYSFGNSDSLMDYIGDADLLALVAMDRRTVMYVLLSALRRHTLYVPASTVTQEGSDMSWTEVMRAWNSEGQSP